MSQYIGGTYNDPLAQTFHVTERYGIFITKIGLFFESVSDEDPVSIELRRTVNGVPSTIDILPGSIVTKSAAEMSGAASTTASVETVFEFPEPIFLFPSTQYAFCVNTNSKDEYRVWTSKVGDFKVNTTQERVSRNIEPGAMFKSQSGLVYSAENNSDIKFNLYRASFKTSNAVAVFKDANPPLKKLGNDPLNGASGDKTIIVSQPNHGFIVSDRVNISGMIDSSTYNGILGSSIQGQRIITGVDGYSYSFEADSAVDSSIDFGGSGILATQQYQYTSAQLQLDTFNPGSTRVNFVGDFTTSKSFAGLENGYEKTATTSIKNNVDHNFKVPHVILSDSNETINNAGGESTTIYSALIGIPGNDETSPILDLQRAQLLTINNLIDRQDSAATVNFNVPLKFVPETDPSQGTALAKHITKPITLANPSDGIKILFAANRPQGSYIDVYYRTTLDGTDSDILEKPFIAADIDIEMPIDNNPTVYREYRYSIGTEPPTFDFAGDEEQYLEPYGISNFNQYQVKIVMNSTSSTAIPKIKDLRTIAVG